MRARQAQILAQEISETGAGENGFLNLFASFEDCNQNGAPDSWDIGAGVLDDADDETSGDEKHRSARGRVGLLVAELLVEQRGFHRGVATLQRADEILGMKAVAQRFRAESGEKRTGMSV